MLGFTERIYLLSGVNMLRNSLEISYTSKKRFMGLILIESDQKITQKHCRADLSSVWDTLTCWLSISVLIRGILGFKVTALFPVYNFSKKSHVRLNFFLKASKSLCRFRKFKKKKKNQEKIFGFEIIDFELVALNTSFYWENILVIGCHYANIGSQDFRYF